MTFTIISESCDEDYILGSPESMSESDASSGDESEEAGPIEDSMPYAEYKCALVSWIVCTNYLGTAHSGFQLQDSDVMLKYIGSATTAAISCPSGHDTVHWSSQPKV